MRQVWQFYPYENSLVTVRATGKLVREALERSADCMADPEESSRSLRLAGRRRVRDRPAPAGAQARGLPPARRQGRDRRGRLHRGAQLAPRRGGGGYGFWKRAERVRETGNVRQMLVADARARKRLTLDAHRQLEARRSAVKPSERAIVDAFHRLYYEGRRARGACTTGRPGWAFRASSARRT